MLNQTNISYQQQGVSLIPRIYPVSMVQPVNSTEHHPQPQTQSFVAGKIYQGQILDKLNNDVYLVKMDNTLVKMPLGNLVQVGQTIPFKFIQYQPAPTFLLVQHPHQEFSAEISEGDDSLLKSTGSTASNGVVLPAQTGAGQASALKLIQNPTLPAFNLPQLSAYGMEAEVKVSSTAQLINQFIQDAKSEGADGRYQASKVVSEQPMQPQVLAKDLKQAISQSGVFYESHLKSFVHGQQTLDAIRQEPQNQTSMSIANLVSQQLNVLEHQRFAWSGEIWPQQQMQLDIFKERQSQTQYEREAKNASPLSEDDLPVKSEMTLHLPNLGKVTAKLTLNQGRLSIQVLADSPSTLGALKKHQQSLVSAFQKNGQALDALTVTHA